MFETIVAARRPPQHCQGLAQKKSVPAELRRILQGRRRGRARDGSAAPLRGGGAVLLQTGAKSRLCGFREGPGGGVVVRDEVPTPGDSAKMHFCACLCMSPPPGTMLDSWPGAISLSMPRATRPKLGDVGQICIGQLRPESAKFGATWIRNGPNSTKSAPMIAEVDKNQHESAKFRLILVISGPSGQLWANLGRMWHHPDFGQWRATPANQKPKQIAGATRPPPPAVSFALLALLSSGLQLLRLPLVLQKLLSASARRKLAFALGSVSDRNRLRARFSCTWRSGRCVVSPLLLLFWVGGPSAQTKRQPCLLVARDPPGLDLPGRRRRQRRSASCRQTLRLLCQVFALSAPCAEAPARRSAGVALSSLTPSMSQAPVGPLLSVAGACRCLLARPLQFQISLRQIDLLWPTRAEVEKIETSFARLRPQFPRIGRVWADVGQIRGELRQLWPALRQFYPTSATLSLNRAIFG